MYCESKTLYDRHREVMMQHLLGEQLFTPKPMCGSRATHDLREYLNNRGRLQLCKDCALVFKDSVDGAICVDLATGTVLYDSGVTGEVRYAQS